MPIVAHHILIFTPTYNEAGNIGNLLTMIVGLGLPADILVIDDDSSDDTAKIVEQIASANPCLRLQRRPGKLGIGSAHLAALRLAKDQGYGVLVTMDADFLHHPSDIPRLLAKLDEYDLVIGSRFQAANSLIDWEIERKVLTHLAHALTSTMLGMSYDASSGFRCYRLSRISDELLAMISSRDYEFFFESLAVLHEAKLRIGEVPVTLRARTYGRSKMKFRHMLRGLLRLFNLRLNLGSMKRRYQVIADRKAGKSVLHD